MFVFAYGSLAAELHGTPLTATIGGFIRTWDVAMDNVAEIPGYKYYVDPVTGERPAVHVTFLNLTPDERSATVGFLLPVDPRRLAELDHRERNYDRVEVTEQITTEPPIKTRVYTYLGTAQARERYASADRPVIARAYLEAVEASFRSHDLWQRYLETTRPPDCPVHNLTRVNLRTVGQPVRGPAAASAPRTAPPDTRSPRR